MEYQGMINERLIYTGSSPGQMKPKLVLVASALSMQQ